MRPLALLPALLILSSGCLATTGSGIEPQPVAQTTNVQTVAVEFSGTTANDACLLNPVLLLCHYVEPGTGEHVELGIGGSLHVYGNLTWSPTSAATRELNVHVVVDDVDVEDGPTATGPSPLVVDFDLRQYQGHNVALGVSATKCACTSGTGAQYTLPQEFVFRGVYVSAAQPGTSS